LGEKLNYQNNRIGAGKYMRQIVLLKVIPDLPEIKIERDTRKPIFEGVKHKISEVDKRALETAIKIKEKAGGKVFALSLGDEKTQTALLEALAIGADEIFVVNDPKLSDLDANASSLVLKKGIDYIGEFDLVLTGEMSLDKMNSQMGPRLAELLDLPLMTYVKEFEYNEGVLRVVRDLEEYDEIVQVPIPSVLSVTREINEPRIPGLMQIMKAKKKLQTILKAKDLNINPSEIQKQSYVDILSLTAPEIDRKRVIIEADSIEEVVKKLVTALRDEGVI
jgi:electron transfer flavoprotein beta subunit